MAATCISSDCTATNRPRSVGITILSVLALLYSLYFARDFLIPILYAALLNLLLSPVVRDLVGGRGAHPSLIGRSQRVEAEGLRRLYAGKSGTIDGLAQRIANTRQRIADRQYWRCALEEFEAGE